MQEAGGGEDEGKGKMIAKYRIEAPKRAEKTGSISKLTSVRKGMGSAKYSTLITTVPAEMCRALGIGAGDNLVWGLKEGEAAMTVSKFGVKAMYNAEVLYSKMLQLRKLAKNDASVRAFAEREIKRMEEEFGPVKKLSDKELERERKEREENARRKWLEKKRREQRQSE